LLFLLLYNCNFSLNDHFDNVSEVIGVWYSFW